MKLPRELRDLIYRMLLTTPYCTHFSSTTYYPSLQFHLHPAILSVSKQISEEATEILYQENDFIVLKTTGLDSGLGEVPEFELLSENRITSPMLIIELANADGRIVEVNDQQTVITTLEGLQSIISAIWELADNDDDRYNGANSTDGDLRLTLNFNPKGLPRYKGLSDLVLKPWDKVNGLKELVLRGDIKKPMRIHLQKYILKGPFAIEAADSLLHYYSLAKRMFLQEKDYDAARWWWTIFDEYWTYLLCLRPYHLKGSTMCQEGNKLWDVLRALTPKYFVGMMYLVITCFRLKKYEEAVEYARDALEAVNPDLEGWAVEFGDHVCPKMHAMFQMCVRIMEVALDFPAERNLFANFVEFLIVA
jgi:hypothetical protein